jgi:radical SAM superfamily enzyme YgiQ (UPF0313 family)
MNALLINPPSLRPIQSNTPSFVDEEGGCYPPLGLMLVAAAVRARGRHEVRILDALALRLDDEAVEREIRSCRPDVVGVTVMSFTLLDALAVAGAAKRAVPGVVVVAGGPHVHLYGHESVSHEAIDYVVRGEGENTFPLLLDELARGTTAPRAVPGLVYRDGATIIETPPPEPTGDLDTLPPPARDLVPVDRYHSLLSGRSAVSTMFTSRGCPYRCIFCDRPHLGKRFRAHSAHYVVDEMVRCRQMGIRELLIYDDTFTVDRQRVVDICTALIRRRLDIAWDIRARVDTVDPELLDLLHTAGCERIHYGVEAGTDEILAMLCKGITVEQVRRAFAWTRGAGIETLAYFMIGSPGERIEHIERTIELACELKPAYAHFAVTTPFPGTALYRRGLDKGLFDDFWQAFAAHPTPAFTPRYWEESLSREQLHDLLKAAYKQFYCRPGYIARRLTRIRSWSELTRKIRGGLRVLSS